MQTSDRCTYISIKILKYHMRERERERGQVDRAQDVKTDYLISSQI